ncbi:hypothetical protein EDC17_101337 [Sphingobacterium alimentarium]|uniref:Uncharacterized protein n=1 Tax=Sphingobacterium alimentarium TaxID=797292 RepID=A0A4R3W0L9_9SPHI|nr:hypothetical protein EDC17_101337 [Sphingobacterium alimentarium]
MTIQTLYINQFPGLDEYRTVHKSIYPIQLFFLTIGIFDWIIL